MATVRNTITLQDRMTPVLRSVIKALNSTMTALAGVDNISDRAFASMRRDIQAASDAVDQLDRNTDELGNSARRAAGSFTSFKNPLVTMSAGLYTAQTIFAGLGKVTGLADNLSSTTARLNLMNDGLQTTAELQNMILASSNASRSSYMDTAAVVSKLGILAGSAFKDNKEMVFFAEQMNKQFKVGGAGIQEQTSAMYQLTQAMAAGKLQGDEFRSIMENAPLLAQAIARYTGKTMGELKTMSSEGKITADIIKNAMIASAEETNQKFAEMPVTFGQAMTLIKNQLVTTVEPIMKWMSQGAAWIAENWQSVVPVVIGLATALTTYGAVLGIVTAAHWIATGAAKAFFIALAANPIMWVALAVGVLIGFLYRWIQAVGGVKIAWVMVRNAVLGVIGDMYVGVVTGMENMINGAIKLLNGFIELLNKIPGVQIEAITEMTRSAEAQLMVNTMKKTNAMELDAMRKELAAERAKEGSANNMITGGTLDSVGSLGKIDGDVSITEEDLKMLKDIAATEFINKYTTMTPNMTISFGDVRETADVDVILSTIETMVQEAYASSLVGEGM